MNSPEQKLMTNKGHSRTELPATLNGNTLAGWMTKDLTGLTVGQVKQVLRLIGFAV